LVLAAFKQDLGELPKNSVTVLVEFAVVKELVYNNLFPCKDHHFKRLEKGFTCQYLRVPFVVRFQLSTLSRNITDCVVIALSQVVHSAVQFFSLFEKSINYSLDIVRSQVIFLLLSFTNSDLIDSVLNFVLTKEDFTFQILHHGNFVLKAS
jgi:hypothetical protein